MEVGKTIGQRREKPEKDSERDRVRKKFKKKQAFALLGVVVFLGILVYLLIRVGAEWYRWISRKEEVIEITKEPRVEIIDDLTGQRAEQVSVRMKEYIAELEEEFALLGKTVTLAHIPQGKMREVDVELEGVSGIIKISIERNAAVSAEDAERMLKYLGEQGIESVEYIDVRIPRKGYWK